MASLPLLIAKRYLSGKNTTNAVPLLSKISMVALGIGAAALIILFSVSNGFNTLIKDLYNVFYPPIRITATQGKFFKADDAFLKKIQGVEGVAFYTRVMEDNVLVEGNEEQMVATVKGVEPAYFQLRDLEPFIIAGVGALADGERATALVGRNIAGNLGMDVNNAFSLMHLFYPRATEDGSYQSPENSFNRLDVKPDGVFEVQQDFDNKFILASYPKIAQLFEKENEVSSIEIKIKEGEDEEAVQQDLKKVLGEKFSVATRYEQNKTLYNVMNGEKMAMYLILVLVLVIASFNMVGALMLMVVEKGKDLAILNAMGMSKRNLRATFLWEGVLWSAIGGSIGLTVGVLLCLGQKYFGWLEMGKDFIIEAYPVTLSIRDVGIVFFTVVLIGFLASLYPSYKAARQWQHSLR